LRKKLDLANVYEQEEMVCLTIVQLLQLNTTLKDELLPLYVRKTLPILLAEVTTKEKKEKISKEIDGLREFWSSDYDLIRLSIVANSSDDQSLLDLAAALAIHLSEPLQQVLQLQVAIDQKWETTRCRKLLVDQNLYKRDQEAIWRLFIALCHPTLKFPKQGLESFLSILAPDPSSKHQLFSKMELYGQLVPFSLLKNWQKQEKDKWEPYYHLALCYYQSKQDVEQAVSYLQKAYYQMPEDLKEHSLIERTLEYYQPNWMFEGISPEVFLRHLEEFLDQYE
jgi:tetratricopeptide (TPR) repeat protein